MNKTLKTILAGFCALYSAVAHAEDLRIWSDNNGHTIEAKFIDVSGQKIILEKTDGSRIMVPKAGLCEADQVYLADVIPPELKIKVDKDSDSKKLAQGYSWTEKQDEYDLSVSIEKLNSDKCTRSFTAHLYIIAKDVQNSDRKVIGSKDHSFSFEQDNSTQFEGSATVKNEEWYGGKEGLKYEGYLVLIEDDKGKLIAMDSSKGLYEKSYSVIKNHTGGKPFKL